MLGTCKDPVCWLIQGEWWVLSTWVSLPRLSYSFSQSRQVVCVRDEELAGRLHPEGGGK